MRSPHRKNIRQELLSRETFLERFSAPARSALRVAAGYPARYRVGISNLGFHFVLRSLLRSPLNVERFFGDTSPVTLETGSPLSAKAALFFSISYEEDYINVARILVDSGIAPLRTEREEGPLVIAGGPAGSANPFPLAEIADVVALGAGEGVLDAIIDVLVSGGGGPREEMIEGFARIPGLYVPGLSGDGVRINEGPPSNFPSSVVITPESVFPGALLVESGRGCPGACAFCMATTIYRPLRFMPLVSFERLLDSLAAPVRRVGLVSTAVAAHPDFAAIVELLASRGISVSFSSLRAEDLDEAKARLIGSIGTSSVSLAPESGSERLRFALGKWVPDEVYFRSGSLLRRAGVTHFTLYFLCGAPGEDERTEAETKTFLSRFRTAIGERSFSVHVNPLVPKAWTPLQFYGMPAERSLAKLQERIGRDLGRIGLTVHVKSARSAVRQALLSTGDERVGRAIVHHVASRMSWKKALEEAGADGGFPHRRKGPETSFPWDHLAGPVLRGALFSRFEGISKGEPADAAEDA